MLGKRDFQAGDGETYLGKAIQNDRDGNLWLPMDSPYLKALVEAFTESGLARIGNLKDALAVWLQDHGSPHISSHTSAHTTADISAPVVKPGMPVQWTAKELDAWWAYFKAKPRAFWAPEDWAMLIEWLLQKYWSPQWAGSMADWLAVKSSLLGQIEAGLANSAVTPVLAGAIAAAVPGDLPTAMALGLQASKITQAMIAFARERCAQAIVDMGERMKAAVRDIVLDHQRNLTLGGKPDGLETRLFDRLAAANRDWRRIAVTEVSENAAQGVVAASRPGDKLKRIEQYRGICDWCARIDGQVVTVVDPAQPEKDGETEIWPGKTNLGRSSAPRKLMGGKLVEREPRERWWIAAGAQHPNCRGRWLPLNGIDPSALAQFLVQVKMQMTAVQATNPEALPTGNA